MKSFTMNDDTVNRSTIHPFGPSHELASDESGRLYSVRMRELFEDLHVDMSAVEALGALKVAGHMLGLLQERWAERHGLTQGRLGVLFRLYRCGDTHLVDLAMDLDYTPRHLTVILDQLQRDGISERFAGS